MGIRFMGTPLETFIQLLKEAEQDGEKVMLRVSCYKSEETGYPGTDLDGGMTIEHDVLTHEWGMQIKSIKDIFQVDHDDINELR